MTGIFGGGFGVLGIFSKFLGGNTTITQGGSTFGGRGGGQVWSGGNQSGGVSWGGQWRRIKTLPVIAIGKRLRGDRV